MFKLHQRFGREVVGVLEKGLEIHREALAKGEMAPFSLLTLTVGDQLKVAAEFKASGVRNVASTNAAPTITLTIDENLGQYSINSHAPIRAKRSVELLVVLAEQHRKDLISDTEAANFTYLKSLTLAEKLNIEEDALRRRIERIRDSICKVFDSSREAPADRDCVIQSKTWGGYRLNPDLRLVAPRR